MFKHRILNHKNVDSLPSLTQIIQMIDEAKLNSYITNFTKAELKLVWGKTDESNKTEDVCYICNNMKLVVNYLNSNDKAVVCGIVTAE